MSKTSRRIAKYDKLSTEAMKNAIRLHFDSILLFNNESYPSSYNLAVLTLEEISKSDWIDHYVETSTTNNGLPEPDGNEEKKWIKLLYIHTKKHFAFINQQFHELEPSFYDFVRAQKLEYKKQKSIYVGFSRTNGNVNTKSSISLPTQIKSKDAKQIISLNNAVLIAQCNRNSQNGFYYGPFDKYKLLDENMSNELSICWKYRSGIYKK